MLLLMIQRTTQRREAAAIKVQKNQRRHQARRSYKLHYASVLVVQTALRAMAARKEFRFKKQSTGAVTIQVVLGYFDEYDGSSVESYV